MPEGGKFGISAAAPFTADVRRSQASGQSQDFRGKWNFLSAREELRPQCGEFDSIPRCGLKLS